MNRIPTIVAPRPTAGNTTSNNARSTRKSIHTEFIGHHDAPADSSEPASARATHDSSTRSPEPDNAVIRPIHGPATDPDHHCGHTTATFGAMPIDD